MDLKFGLNATTSVMAMLALTGCAQWSEGSVVRDGRFKSDNPSKNEQLCDVTWRACDVSYVALLKAPTNVVYTTRADVTPDAVLETLDSDGAQTPTEDVRAAPESADNTE